MTGCVWLLCFSSSDDYFLLLPTKCQHLKSAQGGVFFPFFAAVLFHVIITQKYYFFYFCNIFWTFSFFLSSISFWTILCCKSCQQTSSAEVSNLYVLGEVDFFFFLKKDLGRREDATPATSLSREPCTHDQEAKAESHGCLRNLCLWALFSQAFRSPVMPFL